jgi:hypothetical protein
MATRTTKTSTVKARTSKTSAPRTARARKGEATDATAMATAPSYEAVAQRAYERFCARGYVHGFDVEDWLAAERELASA